MSYSIVIASGSPRNLKACLDAIERFNPLPRERVVVVLDHLCKTPASWSALWARTEPLIAPSPFNYARNLNLGIAKAQGLGARDIIIMEDDALLMVPRGLDRLYEALHIGLSWSGEPGPSFGACSAEVWGTVCNSNLAPSAGPCTRLEPDMLPTMCLAIAGECIAALKGPFNESFTGYGRDDVDFSWRALDAGFKLGICPACVVDHQSLTSHWRSQPDLAEQTKRSQSEFEKIWGKGTWRMLGRPRKKAK